MDEQESIPRTESAPDASSPQEEFKQIADEAIRHLPVEAILEIAPTGSDILIFDEADSLFGRRSEVKDSHDKYSGL